MQRRHLTKTEKAFIAAADLTREHAAAKERQGHDRGGESKTARQAAAEKRNVSAAYVGYAAAIDNCGDLDLRAKVLAEEIPMAFGARIAAMPLRHRRSLIAASSDKNVRLTPPNIPRTILQVNGIERFCLDPATTLKNPVEARDFYCLERADRNGIRIRFIWVNPPYDDPASWVKRAVEIVEAETEIAIWMLLQSRVIGTTAGRTADRACTSVLHLDKRQKFVTEDFVEMPGSLNDGSLLFAFGAPTCVGLEKFGTVYTPVRTAAATGLAA